MGLGATLEGKIKAIALDAIKPFVAIPNGIGEILTIAKDGTILIGTLTTDVDGVREDLTTGNIGGLISDVLTDVKGLKAEFVDFRTNAPVSTSVATVAQLVQQVTALTKQVQALEDAINSPASVSNVSNLGAVARDPVTGAVVQHTAVL